MTEYSWGVRALDDLMGPIESKTLYCVYGATASGKTHVASYWPPVVILRDRGELRDDERIIIIDGDGGFDAARFRAIVRANFGKDAEARMMKNLDYVEVTTFDEQHKLITVNLEKMIVEKGVVPLLISVDPMTAIYRGIILRTELRHRASVIGMYTGKLDLQLTTLRYLAVEYDFPVFVTTWPSSPVGAALGQEGQEPPEQEFIGGRQFGFLPKVIVRLVVPDRASSLRRAVLWKHRSRPAGRVAEFKITERGLEDV